MAVQHLMWFEQVFQTQGHVLLSWTEWICGTFPKTNKMIAQQGCLAKQCLIKHVFVLT